MTPKDKKKKSIDDLKKEKLKWEIKKLKADTIGVWVKDIRAIILLAGFLLITFTNATIFVKNKTSHKSSKMVMKIFTPKLDIVEGIGTGETRGGGLGVMIEEAENFEIDDYAMASPSLISGIVGSIKLIFTSHISWQFIAFLFLIPLLIDFIRKRKRKEVV